MSELVTVKMAAKRARPSPAASATGFEVGHRMRGNDGRTWEVSATAAGVRRWKPVVTQVVATFRVLLDDLLRVPRGRSSRTVTPDAAPILRRRIKSDDFQFGHILINGVPLAPEASPSDGGLFRRLFGYKNNKARDTVPATLGSIQLIEGAAGKWRVELRWAVSIPEGREVDATALRAEVDGQLSDGWGEGVEQFRFGPVVECDGDYERCRRPTNAARKRELEKDVDLNGRFSFNLAVERIN